MFQVSVDDLPQPLELLLAEHAAETDGTVVLEGGFVSLAHVIRMGRAHMARLPFKGWE